MAKQYTFADVKSHNNNQSAWIVINNSIYDVTAFLNEVSSTLYQINDLAAHNEAIWN